MSNANERLARLEAKEELWSEYNQVGGRITANYTHFCNSCYFCRTGQENFCEHPEAHFDGMAEYVCWHMSQV